MRVTQFIGVHPDIQETFDELVLRTENRLGLFARPEPFMLRVSHIGDVTYAMLERDPFGARFEGVSIRNPEDANDPETGERKAVERAIARVLGVDENPRRKVKPPTPPPTAVPKPPPPPFKPYAVTVEVRTQEESDILWRIAGSALRIPVMLLSPEVHNAAWEAYRLKSFLKWEGIPAFAAGTRILRRLYDAIPRNRADA